MQGHDADWFQRDSGLRLCRSGVSYGTLGLRSSSPFQDGRSIDRE